MSIIPLLHNNNTDNEKTDKIRRCFIIAEAGVNHNGSLKLAKMLVDAAKNSGADAVKFQTYRTEKIVTRNAEQAGYQKKNSPSASQYDMLKKFELSENDFKELYRYSIHRKIMFLSTPFDPESAEFLNKLGVPAFKISSGELTNTPFLTQIAKYNKPVILSTGMSTLKEVKNAVGTIFSSGNKKLVLLHCTSSYPARDEDINLKAMLTLKKKFNLPVGYSDHTIGNVAAIAAAALGAEVIEKHLTLNKNLPGPDHKASAAPSDFALMVQSIRSVEKMLGSGIKKPSSSEKEVMRAARKSVVSLCAIPRSTIIRADMLGIKRPGNGIPPSHINKIIGKKTTVRIAPDKVIKPWMYR